MKVSKMQRHQVGAIAWVAVALLVFGAQLVSAQVVTDTLKIQPRALTPQEITDYGLTNTTQTASGNPVVGLGQPVYMGLMLDAKTDAAVTVTKVTWTLNSVVDVDNLPVSSSAAITNSPITMSMTNYYNVGDEEAYTLLDNAMIVPDVRGTYKVEAQVETASNGTFTATLDVVGSTYLGHNYEACTLCHKSKQANFNATLHAEAFKDQISGDGSSHFGPTCIKCHVLGYDDAPGAVNGGWDDVAAAVGWTFPTNLVPSNWDDMTNVLQNVSNIQCENCHGPAQEHMRSGGDTSKIAVNLSAGNCGQCHDALTHHVKNFQWDQTPHARGQAFRNGSCAPCHSAKGYITAHDPGVNEFGETVPTEGTYNEGITCAACHDPHSPGAGAHQLRKIQTTLENQADAALNGTVVTNAVELMNGTIITNGGDGLVCMACHHARRDAASYVASTDVTAHNHFGPHHGPQADMLAGQNAVEYGQDMPTSKHLSQVADSCVQCHMQEADDGNVIPSYAQNKVGGHTFLNMYEADGTNPEYSETGTCKNCHGGITDFDFGGEDYDRNGVVEGVQSEIDGLLDQLGMLLPPLGSTAVNAANFEDIDSSAGMEYGQELKYREAMYNYQFVHEDRSEGVHNPKYAAAILQASIDNLTIGGTDVDHDGLPDAWEMQYFGDLTSQSGSSDFDGDGLTNLQEYNLGTDPTKTDTDGDGYSDLVEFQAGSVATLGGTNSVPNSDMLILPAKEIGYLPTGTNSTVQFQSIDALNGGSWTDLGTAQTNSNGNWVYQLDSTRGTTNKFYRAVEE